MIEVADIADQLNGQAAALVPDLLPNGARNGNKWTASGIADTGGSHSLVVNLSGSSIGHWRDFGNAPAGEEKGDVLDLVRLIHCGGDMKAAVNWAKHHLGIADRFTPGAQMDPETKARRAAEARRRAEKREAEEAGERARKAAWAKALYLSAGTMAGTPASRYLKGRGLNAGPTRRWPGSLRFHEQVWHRGEKAKLPAMLGAIYNAAGQQIGIHRIYLQPDAQSGRRGAWTKLDSPEAKLVGGNMKGGFVPINKGASGKSMSAMPPHEPVYVTEGIEDAVAVRMIKPAARIIAAITLGNIGDIILPECARRLIIVADRDEKKEAQSGLERSVAQQQSRGMQVQLVMPPAEVNGEKIKDFNDWLLASSADGASADQRPDGDNAPDPQQQRMQG